MTTSAKKATKAAKAVTLQPTTPADGIHTTEAKRATKTKTVQATPIVEETKPRGTRGKRVVKASTTVSQVANILFGVREVGQLGKQLVLLRNSKYYDAMMLLKAEGIKMEYSEVRKFIEQIDATSLFPVSDPASKRFHANWVKSCATGIMRQAGWKPSRANGKQVKDKNGVVVFETSPKIVKDTPKRDFNAPLLASLFKGIFG